MIDVNALIVREYPHKMGKRYLLNSWIPNHHTDNNKLQRRTKCEHFLETYQDDVNVCSSMDILWENDRRSYLNNRSLVTHDSDGVTSIMIISMTTKEHMVSVFLDAHGILLIDVLPTIELQSMLKSTVTVGEDEAGCVGEETPWQFD